MSEEFDAQMAARIAELRSDLTAQSRWMLVIALTMLLSNTILVSSIVLLYLTLWPK